MKQGTFYVDEDILNWSCKRWEYFQDDWNLYVNDFSKLGAIIMGFDTSIENSFGKYEYDKGRVQRSIFHIFHTI